VCFMKDYILKVEKTFFEELKVMIVVQKAQVVLHTFSVIFLKEEFF
jgi:hypothetical protein